MHPLCIGIFSEPAAIVRLGGTRIPRIGIEELFAGRIVIDRVCGIGNSFPDPSGTLDAWAPWGAGRRSLIPLPFGLS